MTVNGDPGNISGYSTALSAIPCFYVTMTKLRDYDM